MRIIEIVILTLYLELVSLSKELVVRTLPIGTFLGNCLIFEVVIKDGSSDLVMRLGSF